MITIELTHEEARTLRTLVHVKELRLARGTVHERIDNLRRTVDHQLVRTRCDCWRCLPCALRRSWDQGRLTLEHLEQEDGAFRLALKRTRSEGEDQP